LVLACALAFVRAGGEGRSVPVAVPVLIVALAGWGARGHFAPRDLEAEQRAPQTRAIELATRAFIPGSAVGWLRAIARGAVGGACGGEGGGAGRKGAFAQPGGARRSRILCGRAAVAVGLRPRPWALRWDELRHACAAPCGRGRPLRHRGARARGPRRLRAG